MFKDELEISEAALICVVIHTGWRKGFQIIQGDDLKAIQQLCVDALRMLALS